MKFVFLCLVVALCLSADRHVSDLTLEEKIEFVTAASKHCIDSCLKTEVSKNKNKSVECVQACEKEVSELFRIFDDRIWPT